MKRGIGAMVTAALALALAGCSADCACVGVSMAEAPEWVEPATDVTLEFDGIVGGCCDGGTTWPWSNNDGPPESANVVVRDLTGEVWVQQSVEVNDDASATATVSLPNELPTAGLIVTVNGEEVGRLEVRD